MVDLLDSSVPGSGPVRTCIGCRQRAAKRELLRLVAGTDADGQAGSWSVVPDPSSTAPGRGAHLHPTSACLALAERRRAFARALRHDVGTRGPLRTERLREHLDQHQHDSAPNQSAPFQNGSTSS
ncbi:YlxR family protein [Nocardioides korecus]